MTVAPLLFGQRFEESIKFNLIEAKKSHQVLLGKNNSQNGYLYIFINKFGQMFVMEIESLQVMSNLL